MFDLSKINESCSFDISFDEKNIVTKIGNWEHQGFFMPVVHLKEHHTLYKVDILKSNNIDVPEKFRGNVRNFVHILDEAHKYFYEYFGKKFYARLIKASYDYWVKPVEPMARLVAQGIRVGGKICPALLESMWVNLDIVTKAYLKGEYLNLLPIVAVTGLSPSELKSKLSQDEWENISSKKQYLTIKIAKVMLDCSLFPRLVLAGPYQNFFIGDELDDVMVINNCNGFSGIGGRVLREGEPENFPGDMLELQLDRLKFIMQLKATTIVRRVVWDEYAEDDAKLWADTHAKVSNDDDWYEKTRTFRDTKRMAIENNFEFDANWGFKKMFEVFKKYCKASGGDDWSKRCELPF
jgi:hypothetical protein